MSYKARYEKGDWKTACDICGKLFKASSLRRRWDGFMVCPTDFEHRQTQDFVRGVADIQAPGWTRPEVQDTFITIATPTGNAIAGIAIAGLAIAGNNLGVVDPTPPSSFTV